VSAIRDQPTRTAFAAQMRMEATAKGRQAMPVAPPNPGLVPPPNAPDFEWSRESRRFFSFAEPSFTPPHPRQGFFLVFWRA